MTQLNELDQAAVFGRERQSLRVGVAANLFMAAAGIVTAVLSNSDAILMDGLFSLVGFASAIVAIRISLNLESGPDRIRPLGYGADESLFTTFRALSLLGVLMFALGAAVVKIVRYVGGDDVPALNFGPIAVYFFVICLTCLGLWVYHRRNWIKSGRVSEILRLEAKAATFDGAVTAAAGAGLLGIHYLSDTVLAPVAPIGDSIVVLVLCSMAFFQYFGDFRRGLAELAGVTAPPQYIAAARRAVRAPLADWGGALSDMAVFKTGRTYHVVLLVTPSLPVSGNDVDRLTVTVRSALLQALGQANVFVVITQGKV